MNLRAMVWEGRVVSASTVGSTLNAARVAIGDSGEAQRLIQTVPRKGFRFVGLVSEREAPAPEALTARGGLPPEIHPRVPSRHANAIALSAASNSLATPIVGPPVAMSVPAPTTTAPSSVRVPLLAAGTVLGFALAVAAYLVWLAPGPRGAVTAGTQQFDASTVPLVSDEVRRSLASYPARSDIKVLAIGSDRFSVVDNATDVERAKREALRQCSTAATRCRIYAVGMDVVWTEENRCRWPTRAICAPSHWPCRSHPATSQR